MYAAILALHSFVRWLVVISILTALYRAYRGWAGNRPFEKADGFVRTAAVSIIHLQFVLGISLYVISPIVRYFLHEFSQAVHQRAIRFFGMEHSLMMILAVTLVTIGSAKSKRQSGDKARFKTMAIWFTLAFLVILSSVPWPFSPLTSRPWIRPF